MSGLEIAGLVVVWLLCGVLASIWAERETRGWGEDIFPIALIFAPLVLVLVSLICLGSIIPRIARRGPNA